MTIEEFALGIILGLITNVIQQGIDYGRLNFFEQRKVRQRVENAVAAVVEPLLPFLTNEGVDQEKQRRLLQTCVYELSVFTKNPVLLFEGSLNGQKLFDHLYDDKLLPETVVEDGLMEVYALLFPRIAELLCKIPAAMKEWENLAWAENYRRLDEVITQLRALFSRVDTLMTQPTREADAVLTRVRRTMVQKVGLTLDITGLRGDQPYSGTLSDFFVHPQITESLVNENQTPRSVERASEALEQFVQAQRLSIVVGAGGMGKSTWTKWLQREVLNSDRGGLAVRVELRGLSIAALPSLQALVRDAAGTHLAEDLSSERIERWLGNQQVIFMLDGFDEIAPMARNVVYQWIVDLCVAVQGCPVLVTSRPLTTDHMERQDLLWSRWVIEPFNKRRIVDYIERWYRAAPLLPDSARTVDAPALAEEWQKDVTLAVLTGNPLLLSTLLMVHHLDGHLPSGRAQLYRRYIEGMLGLWDDRRQVAATAVLLSLEQKKQILRGLALHLFLQERDRIDETAVLDWLAEYERKLGHGYSPELVLAALSERSGLIVGPGIYTFAHKSIAEYLVAETVWQGDQTDSAGQRIDRLYIFA